MIKLQEQLKYFVVKKVSTDELWKGVKVYLSGHETPGEGEHKIMDFIRYCKSQPDYDPYTRHCLYGLDADLIMLGSVSHEPYFSLLREEVRFVKLKSGEKKPTSPEKINFYLLHLSILRDYLEIEFSEIKEKHPSLFNIENIIDDWVFMCILVGNDFIPHLPSYHINKNSLVLLYKAYIEVLPKLKGYINEEGQLNLERLEIFFERLAELEQDQFNDNSKEFEVFKERKSRIKKKDKKLINFFGDDDEVFEDALESETVVEPEDLLGSESDADESSSEEENGFMNSTEFDLCKRNYYERKLDLKVVTKEIVREHTFAYIEALQWNLYYYYDGCQSWSWYYPYHYAPYVSDIKNFKDFKIKFPKDKPLLPYEQLLGVLPISSKRFLPDSYQRIMIAKDSPLFGCYPTDFKLDQNGKTAPWEAVVLIPHLKEELLLAASAIAKRGLTDQERSHNRPGPHLLYEYSEQLQPDFPSPLPLVFPNITANRAKCTELPDTQFHLPVHQIKKGISKKIKLQTHFFGFPSLKFLKFTARIKNEKVRVFETFSRLDNVILKLENVSENSAANLLPLLNKNIYFNWPYPKECKMISLFDGQYLHSVPKSGLNATKQKLPPNDEQKYAEKMKNISDFLLEKRGIRIEDETAICSVKPVIGHAIKVNEDGTITKEKQYSSSEIFILAKTTMPKLKIVLPKVSNEIEKAADIYKPGARCFLLEKKYYGDLGEILSYDQQTNKVRVRVTLTDDPDISEVWEREDEVMNDNYLSNTQMARTLNLMPLHVSKITGSVFVTKGKNKFNIGLNLKFNEKRQQIANFSRKENDVWYFSNDVCEIIYDYVEQFPTVTNEIFNYNQNELDYKNLFPMGDAEAQFRELLDYLKDLPTTREKKQSINARILDKCLVGLIEETLQSSIMFLEEPKTVEITTDARSVFCSSNSFGFKTHPDPNARFNLYDRVVNVKAGILVPQGLKGIVIGIEDSPNDVGNSMITIVFDEEFEGGLKINTKHSCAYSLPQCYLMNISFGKRNKHKANQKAKEMFNCVLPPLKSKHHQKEVFIAPKQKVEDPYYDESKNYWATLNSNGRHSAGQDHQQQPFKSAKQAYQNDVSGKSSGETGKQPQKSQPKQRDHLSVWNKLMASEKPKANATVSTAENEATVFDLSSLSKVEAANKLSKKLIDKINKYYSTKLKRHCKQHCKGEPQIVIRNGPTSSASLSLTLVNGQTLAISQTFRNLSEQQINEEICKLALNKLNLSTVMPPTFILNKPDANLTSDFTLPTPPVHWLA